MHWSVAGFGQATYHVTDEFRLTGIRYNYDFDADPSFNFSGFSKASPTTRASTSEPTALRGRLQA